MLTFLGRIRERLFNSRLRWVVDGVLLVIIATTLGWSWVPPGIPNKNCGLASNAAWTSVDWTSYPVDETSVAQLAENMSARKVRYLYPFTTYIKPDGSFSLSYTYAAEFVSQFRRFNQETHLLAWIGIPLQWVDLADEGVRYRIITFIAQLVREAQFNGVHLNAETILNNNLHYLLFLEEISSALGPDYVISVAGSQWVSAAWSKLPLINDNQVRWSSDYYQAVADRVDQIAVMAYDSAKSWPVLYRLWLREQVRGLSRSFTGSNTELLIGISISREHTTTHHPKAENMENGLAGICAGLTVSKVNTVQGVAVYASWEAEEADWQMWNEWVSRPKVDSR